MASTKSYVTLFLCLLECIFFGGTIFGFNVLVYVFKKDGIYSQVCNNNVNDSSTLQHAAFEEISPNSIEDRFQTEFPQCPEQAQHFSLAYTLSIAAVGITAIPLGWLFDKFGLMVTRTVGSVLAITGLLMLGLLTPATSYLIYPGGILLSAANHVIRQTNNHVCLLAGARASTLVAIYSGASSASGVVLQFVKLAYSAGIPRKYSMAFLTGLWAIVLVTTYILLPRCRIESSTPPTATKDSSHTEGTNNIEMENNNNPPNTLAIATGNDIATVASASPKEEVRHPTFLRTLCDVSFLVYLYWFSALHFRAQYFIGSFNQWVTEIVAGDATKVSLFTDVYGYSITATFVIAPIIGVIVDRKRKQLIAKGCFSTSADREMVVLVPLVLASLATTLQSVAVLVETEWMVYVTIGLAHFSRAFLYSSAFSVLTLAFPVQYYGKLFGVTYFVGGVANLLQYPVTMWANKIKSFMPPNVVFLVLVLLTFVHPIAVWWRYRRSQKQKARREKMQMAMVNHAFNTKL